MHSNRDFHVFRTVFGRHLYLSDGSRIYDLPPDLDAETPDVGELARSITSVPPRIDGTPLSPPPLQTLSLNVAQACNMACTYCYADEGAFGGKPKLMGFGVARASVDRLIDEAAPGADLLIGFMGGEPFLHRQLLHAIMPYATQAAQASGRSMRFSLTTNGTLVEPEDVDLLTRYTTQVAVSIDGPRSLHDASRPLRSGGSSYDRLLRTLRLFAQCGRPRHLSARITVTPRAKNLREILEHVVSLGFDSAGFAPVLVSPRPADAFTTEDFIWFLEGMKECGTKAVEQILARRPYPFSNFETAMQELERGSHRPYPCGAGAAYLSVAADGKMFACHRLVENPTHHFGDVWSGSNVPARAEHLRIRHVDRQEPCKSCWARYLCGGGCYHEVDMRGRPACDYIRGWLDFCLTSYLELKVRVPQYFTAPADWLHAPQERPTNG